MGAKQVFRTEQTHRVLQQFGADVETSSENLGWSSAFASIQREQPFDGRFDAAPNSLIVMPRKGPADMTYRIDGRIVSRQVKQGGVFFLPAGRVCEVVLHSVLDTIHVYLHSDLFANRENDARDCLSGLAPMLGEFDAIIEHLVAAIEKIVSDDHPTASLLADTIAQALANRFIAINHRGSAQREARSNQLSHRKIRQVRDFVEANLAADIKLSAMANICSVSSEYFLRLFKSTVGVSPHQYVLNLRIGRAKALLGDPGRSLSDIAAECGFSHQQHLTSTFRRFTGVTPGAYRRGQ
jgi:AraC family transcriptional regulator